MMKRLLSALMIVLALPAVVRADEEPHISAALSQDQIYEGQSVEYRVTVENVEDPKTPELGRMDDFAVAFQGKQSLNSQQITIINGAMHQIVHRGAVFQFLLTPKKAGTLRIPGATVTAGGKTLSAAELQLVVLPPTAQDLAVVELSADHTTVYPTQPFTVTLSVFVRELPPPVSDRDPLSVQKPPPALRIPWLADQDLPTGLTPKEDWQTWVKRFINAEGSGFGINGLASQSAFSIFGESNALAFRPKPQTVVRRNAQGQEAKYRRYDFPRVFTAKQLGSISFAPVTLQGSFAENIAGPGRLAGKDVYAASKPLEITVRDVPKDGRPDNYLGAVGHFQLEAELTPRQAKVGDPLTFTLTVRGTGSLADAKAPDLSHVPAVAARFKVYEATQKSAGDAAHFIYSLRPLVEGNEPFPPVPVSYFDVDQEQFAVLLSDPIPLSVSKSEQLSGDQIVASAHGAERNAKELEARREGIFADITDPAMARDQAVHPLRWLEGLGGCVGTYLLVLAITVVVRRRTGDRAALRRRGAPGRARQQLRGALVQWKAQQIREAADEIQDALIGLVADVADVQEAGWTPKDVLRQLQNWAIPAELTERVRHLLETCDAARYGATAASGELGEEAQQVLHAVIEALRTQKRFR
jgi:hypothetical protein